MKSSQIIALMLGLVLSGALCSSTLTKVEYFIDSDPGPGNGTQLYGRNTVDIDELIDTSTLASGIHRLYVRAKNNLGLWSLPQVSVFFIPYPPKSFDPDTIESIEYFYDTDPGPGNGNPVYGRNTVELNELLDTSELANGIHHLYVRSKSENGLWSMPQSLTFLIPWNSETGSDITRLEYFIDTDPGFGNGTQVAVTPGASVSKNFPVIVGPLEHGNHTLYVRGRNSEGSWGLPASCQFSDGIPAFLTITENEGMVIVYWEDLYGIDTYKVYSAQLPSGTYAEDLSGTFGSSSWTSPLSEWKKFYHVTSIYEE